MGASCGSTKNSEQLLLSCMLYTANTACSICWKLGVPSPVTGSQPTVAFQLAYGMIPAPSITIPFCKSTPAQPTAAPSVISLRLEAILYNSGLTKPSAGLPARNRASLRRAMMAATTGDAAEVPPFGVAVPLIKVR